MSEVWMNYTQLAELWQMSPEAARTRARRGRFPRRVGNGGQAEVLVDSSAPLPKARPPRSGGQSRASATLPAPDNESPPATAVKALEALEGHVATLRDQLAKAEALASERGREVAVERERVADLTAQLLRLTGELLDARKAELPPPRRSWWQRLSG